MPFIPQSHRVFLFACARVYHRDMRGELKQPCAPHADVPAEVPAEVPADARHLPHATAIWRPASRRFLSRLRLAVVKDTENLNARILIARLLVGFLPALCLCRIRTAIYRLAGIPIGARTVILGSMKFTETRAVQERLRIGANVVINVNFFADLTSDIRIGNGVSVGHHVVMITADHAIGPPNKRAGTVLPKPIEIGDGCWIGARCTILPGVHIGASSIVAAGSLVSSDVPPNKLVGGVPARIIKSLSNDQ